MHRVPEEYGGNADLLQALQVTNSVAVPKPQCDGYHGHGEVQFIWH